MMESDSRLSFRKLMKLKTICTGAAFVHTLSDGSGPGSFPENVMAQTSDFVFEVMPNLAAVLSAVRLDQDIDLVFLDTDDSHLPTLTMFVAQLREIRPKLPLIVFSRQANDAMRYLLRSGATWHYLKSAPQLANLAADINRHIFLPARWQDVFDYYARDDVKPRIEPGLTAGDLQALEQFPEERYIIKRLFASSDVVQIFRMDEGFSGSRIYTVKPGHQLKRILKIASIDDLEAVQEKQESLIQPRLYRQVGQIRGKVISAEHLAGACYSLAGSNQEVLTLTQFLQDHNRVRKSLIDKIVSQLRDSLRELYSSHTESELRYWAPLYSRILPPSLVIENAVWAASGDGSAQFTLDCAQLANISAVPNNKTLKAINQAVQDGQNPELLLKGFEIAEVNSTEGVLYLQDTLVEQYGSDGLLRGKEHPILRFKVHLQPSQFELLKHPVMRRGKAVAVRGFVSASRETVLAGHIGDVVGTGFDPDSPLVEMASSAFLSPIDIMRFLLWDIGREDMIIPAPIVAPVIHGDLNAGNILVEADSETPLWLIDFSDARAGHILFDVAKLEIEFRTHVFYRLFREMVEEKLWDATTTTKFLLLIENLLLTHAEADFEDFAAALRDYQSDWYDDLYAQFPLYFENLLYFLYSLRRLARTFGPDRFRQHYPVALFFQSISAIKYRSLDQDPWQPWARRLALCCALVNGKEAVAQSRRPRDIGRLLAQLRQRSALALITVGQGEQRKYLMQWNKNWGRFNLVGGRLSNQKGDRDSFGRAIQRKMKEELALRSPKDYHIIRERQPVIRQQFSRRQHIFKDYEFRVFEIELLPRHPRSEEEFAHLARRFAPGHENVLVSAGEINHLRTVHGRPISETTRIILQTIGEIEAHTRADQEAVLAFHVDELRPMVTRGRAQITGSLVNIGFGKLAENILVEVLPRAGYEIEPQSTIFHIRQLDAGYDYPIEIGVQPLEQDTKLSLRVTYYDTRGHEYQQIIEHPIHFRNPVFSLFQLDNPYVPGKPLHAGADAVFAGREDAFTWLGSKLLNGEKAQSLVITGAPRIGKTSLLLQLANGSSGRVIRSYAKGLFLPLYCSIQDLKIEHTGRLFHQLSQIISRGLRNHGISIAPPDQWPADKVGFRQFDRFLDMVENSMVADGRLVLLIDDLHHLRKYIDDGRVSHECLTYFRSLMTYRSRISLVFSGSAALNESNWHILVNAADTLQLQPLSKKHTEQLVRLPAQPHVQYDDLVVERIWRLTGGHPYLIQLLCNRLVAAVNHGDHYPKLVDLPRLAEVTEQIIEDDDGYWLQTWENSGADERIVLSAAAAVARDAQTPFHTSAIRERMDVDGAPAFAELATTLDRLVVYDFLKRIPITLDYAGVSTDSDRGLLLPNDEAYLFANDLLRLWLTEKRPFSKVLSAAYHDRAISPPY